MKILLTGVSSFTGHWIARAAVEAGYEVCCPLTGACSYDGVRRTRMDELPASVRVVEHAAFGTPEFLALVRDFRPQALCHHGAYTKNYRSSDFDALTALANNARQAEEVLKQFVVGGGRLLLITGTFFEANEGQGELPRRAFSPYGLSKTLSSQLFDYYAAVHGLTFGKFVIPNPFGKFEEPRFIAYLMEVWMAGKPAAVRTPNYIRDNIPVDLLASCYALFLGDLFRQCPVHRAVLRPSGYLETQGQFAQRVAREVRARTGLPCMLELAEQTEFPEPRARFNDQAARQIFPKWDERSFWDDFVNYYTGKCSMERRPL
jgi:nucleoside-diphosphate-sugar epimerase